jgi:hypothetical protein
MLTDYLAAEGLIVERLRAQVPGVSPRNVLTAADLAGVQARAQHTPALHVIYDGDEPAGPAGQDEFGATQMAQQRWLVVVAVRSAADTVGGVGARQAAGPLLVDAINALAGHRLGPDHGPLVRASAPRPLFDAGYAYFPQLYRCVVVV